MHRHLRLGFFVVLLALLAGAGARAQGTRATVAGTVKDSRGIALPRITVTIRNLESEADRQAVTATRWHVQRRRPGAGTLSRLDRGHRHRPVSAGGHGRSRRPRGARDCVELHGGRFRSGARSLAAEISRLDPLPGSGRRVSRSCRNRGASIRTIRTCSKAICRSSATTSSWC